jgi:hypothetical protein
MDTKQPRRYLASPAELALNDDGNWDWVVSECGVCGGWHRHGGGDIDSDPRAALGHRAGHCCTIGEFIKPAAGTAQAKAAETLNLSLDGYYLVDADPRHTAELMESVEVHEDDVFVGIALKGGVGRERTRS